MIMNICELHCLKVSLQFQHLCAIIHRTLKNESKKNTMINLYKTMAAHVLYGSEFWVPGKPEIKFLSE